MVVVVVVLVEVVVDVLVVDVVVVVVEVGNAVPPVYPKEATKILLPPITEGGGGYGLFGTFVLEISTFCGPAVEEIPPRSFGKGRYQKFVI